MPLIRVRMHNINEEAFTIFISGCIRVDEWSSAFNGLGLIEGWRRIRGSE